MKKRILAALMCVMMCALLCACGSSGDSVSGKGSAKDVKLGDWHSEIFSDDDVNSAVKAVFEAFEKNFGGCRMTAISFAGDEACAEASADNSGSEAIVFDTAFYADSASGERFTNGSSYLGWMWVLSRTNGGAWQVVKNGY